MWQVVIGMPLMSLWGSSESAAVLRSGLSDGGWQQELTEMKTFAASSGIGHVPGRQENEVRLSAGRRAQAVVQGRGVADGDWAAPPESLQRDALQRPMSHHAWTNIIGQAQPWPLTA